jgi:hypothetical protein
LPVRRPLDELTARIAPRSAEGEAIGVGVEALVDPAIAVVVSAVTSFVLGHASIRHHRHRARRAVTAETHLPSRARVLRRCRIASALQVLRRHHQTAAADRRRHEQ